MGNLRPKGREPSQVARPPRLRKRRDLAPVDVEDAAPAPFDQILCDLWTSLDKVMALPMDGRDKKISDALKKTFGSAFKGRGTMIALKNAMRSVVK